MADYYLNQVRADGGGMGGMANELGQAFTQYLERIEVDQRAAELGLPPVLARDDKAQQLVHERGAENLPVNKYEEMERPEDHALMRVVTSRCREVYIKQWNWLQLRPDATIAIEGPRRSGKTNLLRNILLAMRPAFPEVYIFTGTKMSDEYKGLVPNRYIFDNFETRAPDDKRGPGGMDIFMALWKRQVARVQELKDSKRNDRNIDILVVIEDLVANEASGRGFHDIPLLNRIAFNGRHAHMSIIITSQNIKAIPPAIKANTDVVCVLTVNNKRTKEAIRESFVDQLADDEELEQVFQPLSNDTLNYPAMFIDLYNPRRPRLECLYLCCPEKLEKNFVLGDYEFWSKDLDWLWTHGFRHLVDNKDWGIEPVTYKIDPTGTKS